MSAFQPLSAARAVERVAAAGIANAERVIADFAAAGLIKSYALAIETIDSDGAAACVRGAAVSPEIWKRLVADKVDGEVFAGFAVRLAGSGLIGGAPAVHVTGVGFKEEDLAKLVHHQLGQPIRQPEAQPVSTTTSASEAPPNVRRHRRVADVELLRSGATLLTIAETQTALGLGRTKVNDLMRSGRLTRLNIDGGVRITAESARALAGFSD